MNHPCLLFSFVDIIDEASMQSTEWTQRASSLVEYDIRKNKKSGVVSCLSGVKEKAI